MSSGENFSFGAMVGNRTIFTKVVDRIGHLCVFKPGVCCNISCTMIWNIFVFNVASMTATAASQQEYGSWEWVI